MTDDAKRAAEAVAETYEFAAIDNGITIGDDAWVNPARVSEAFLAGVAWAREQTETFWVGNLKERIKEESKLRIEELEGLEAEKRFRNLLIDQQAKRIQELEQLCEQMAGAMKKARDFVDHNDRHEDKQSGREAAAYATLISCLKLYEKWKEGK